MNQTVPTPPPIVHTVADLRAAVAPRRHQGVPIGLVPTMGALHAGHASLVTASQAAGAFTVVTIFVNPTQFGPGEDFARYPRNLARDAALLAPAGADLIFAPATEEVYPPGFCTRAEVESLTRHWEGAARPTHFRGVTTVVLKLFNMAQPDFAFFGQKDLQQSVVVRRMVRDLDLPVEVRVCPIVREPDGLAMSSRNVFLSADERRRALCLPSALRDVEERFAAGERSAAILSAALRARIESTPGVQLDYAAIVDAETLEEVSAIAAPSAAIAALRVGATRLLDNALLGPEFRSR